MSENTTTETTAPLSTTEQWRAAQERLATPEGAAEAVARVRANQDASLRLEMHRRWGYADEDMAQGLEKAAYATQRLGLSDEAATEAEKLLGPAGALELAAEWGDALSSLPPDMTPAQAAEEVADLITDRAFYERLRAGDKRALRRWEALTTLAARKAR